MCIPAWTEHLAQLRISFQWAPAFSWEMYVRQHLFPFRWGSGKQAIPRTPGASVPSSSITHWQGSLSRRKVFVQHLCICLVHTRSWHTCASYGNLQAWYSFLSKGSQVWICVDLWAIGNLVLPRHRATLMLLLWPDLPTFWHCPFGRLKVLLWSSFVIHQFIRVWWFSVM